MRDAGVFFTRSTVRWDRRLYALRAPWRKAVYGNHTGKLHARAKPKKKNSHPNCKISLAVLRIMRSALRHKPDHSCYCAAGPARFGHCN